jgi:L-lactate permease
MSSAIAGALTTDRRVQVLLVAFCFGALIEGIAGFGAPVAITASMLAGLGFEPIMAAVLALIANTAPVAFGSLGIPVTTLGGLLAPMLGTTADDDAALSAMVGRQLPSSRCDSAYLVVLYAGWSRMLGVLPAVLVAGVTFAIGSSRCRTTSARAHRYARRAVSLASVAILLKFWKPTDARRREQRAPLKRRRSGSRVWRAYATYGFSSSRC